LDVVITTPEPTTRRVALSMVTAAVRGDAGTVKALVWAADPDGFAVLVHATLTLARTLAGQLLTASGLMACDLWLAETARGHPCAETRLGAELALAHSQTLGEFDELVVRGIGAYNAVCLAADEGFDEVFTAAMLCWRTLLPQAATAAGPILVANCASMLWGGAAQPKPERTEMFGARTKPVEDSPPGPSLSIPVEAEVVRRPPRPTIPAGAPVSYRGLSILRRQEQGIE
jgi:hypothetical protein